MKLLAHVIVPTERGNEAVQDGTLEKTVQTFAQKWHPESMYFAAVEGKRTAFIVVDLPDSSDLVAFSEPFYQDIGADVRLYPAMSPEDLSKGLGKLAQQ